MKKIKLLLPILISASTIGGLSIVGTSCNNNQTQEKGEKLGEENLGLTPSFLLDMKTSWDAIHYTTTHESIAGGTNPKVVDSVPYDDFQIKLEVDAKNLKGIASQFSIVDANSFRDTFGLGNYVPINEAINKGQLTDFKLVLATGLDNSIIKLPTFTTKVNITKNDGTQISENTFEKKIFAQSPSEFPNLERYSVFDQFRDPAAESPTDKQANARLKFNLGSQDVTATTPNETVKLNYFLNLDLYTDKEEQPISFYDSYWCPFEVMMSKGIGNPLTLQVKPDYFLLPTLSIEATTPSKGTLVYSMQVDYEQISSPDQDIANRTFKDGEKQEKFNVCGFVSKFSVWGPNLDQWKKLEYQKKKVPSSFQLCQYIFKTPDIIAPQKIDGTVLENDKAIDFFNAYHDTLKVKFEVYDKYSSIIWTEGQAKNIDDGNDGFTPTPEAYNTNYGYFDFNAEYFKILSVWGLEQNYLNTIFSLKMEFYVDAFTEEYPINFHGFKEDSYWWN